MYYTREYLNRAHREIDTIFRVLFPEHGMAVREEQIMLCHEMLDNLLGRNIALCDAGVGIGKTYAYLVACVLMRKYSLLAEGCSPYEQRPVVISTSSIALQKAILTEYIPFLSRILQENGTIQTPIKAVIRKGKEHFVCDERLMQRIVAIEGKNKNALQKEALLSLKEHYDMDEVSNLSGFDRRMVNVPKFCSGDCPKRGSCRYQQYLDQMLWSRGMGAILTSGTLKTGQGFSHIRKMTGLQVVRRVREYVADSPFEYQKNCLLYLPKNFKKCRRGSQEEAEMIAGHIHSLICSTYGHTLVLFTSYHLMGNVYQMLRDEIPFPMIEVWRHSSEEITRFKQMDNAVLFAAGSCWEGVDFPGDMVSSLIIVRLPFAVPDPISEAQKKEYASLKDYIQAVIVPDMQKKLRQGFGRALRTETDTCVVSILDERAGEGGRYHEEVMCALPSCKMAKDIKDVQHFIRNRKGVEYYL